MGRLVKRFRERCKAFPLGIVLFIGLLLVVLVVFSRNKYGSGPAEEVLGKLFPEYDNDGGQTLVFDWRISRKVLPLDGVEKEMILVNDMFPGPTIKGNVGDKVVVRVYNDLDDGDESTSIHWHGIKQRGSNVMDGATGVTQCGIPPGENLTYEFHLDQSGTYWWHSHVGTQRIDGLFGALIVSDNKGDHYSEPDHYDEELVVILSDHYHQPGKNVLSWYLSRESSGQEPVPSNGFINGHGVYSCDRFMDRELECKPNIGKYAELEFEPGKRYRLRVINAAAMAHFWFSIDEHELQVIEADSTEIQPVKAHYVPISAGQRYSVIVEAKPQQKKGPFWMRAEMNEECFNYKNEELDPEIKGIVRYKEQLSGHRLFDDLIKRVLFKIKKNTSLPSTQKWTKSIPKDMCLDMDEADLKPIFELDAPEVPDKTVVLYSKVVPLQKHNLAPYAFFNRTSWVPAVGAPNLHVELGLINATDTPHVETISSKSRYNKDKVKWGGEQMVIDIPSDSSVQLIISNGDESPHPFHLHGHDFWIVRTYEPHKKDVHGQWDPEDEEHQVYNTKNPIRRDTMTVPRFGHAVIRFKADNPGLWAFHCHILWHLATGMMMQFSEGMGNHNPLIPSQMLQQCQTERARALSLSSK